MRQSSTAKLLAGVLGGLCFLVNAQYSEAHGGDNDPTHVHACIGPQGQLRVIDLVDQCRPSEVPAHWAVQGPKGDAGPQGAAGPAGPIGPIGLTGPAGPAGDCRPGRAGWPRWPDRIDWPGRTGGTHRAGGTDWTDRPAGPTGLTGPMGPTGPAGPAGPAGPGGVRGFREFMGSANAYAFQIPSGVSRMLVELWGGGGAGGAGSNQDGGAGGGGGGYARAVVSVVAGDIWFISAGRGGTGVVGGQGAMGEVSFINNPDGTTVAVAYGGLGGSNSTPGTGGLCDLGFLTTALCRRGASGVGRNRRPRGIRGPGGFRQHRTGRFRWRYRRARKRHTQRGQQRHERLRLHQLVVIRRVCTGSKSQCGRAFLIRSFGRTPAATRLARAARQRR